MSQTRVHFVKRWSWGVFLKTVDENYSSIDVFCDLLTGNCKQIQYITGKLVISTSSYCKSYSQGQYFLLSEAVLLQPLLALNVGPLNAIGRPFSVDMVLLLRSHIRIYACAATLVLPMKNAIFIQEHVGR